MLEKVIVYSHFLILVCGFEFNFIPGKGCGGEFQILTLRQDETGSEDAPCGIILLTESSFKYAVAAIGTSSSSNISTQINIPHGKLSNELSPTA